jgi:hypothetical protein
MEWVIRQVLHRQVAVKEKIALGRGLAKGSGNIGFSNGG